MSEGQKTTFMYAVLLAVLSITACSTLPQSEESARTPDTAAPAAETTEAEEAAEVSPTSTPALTPSVTPTLEPVYLVQTSERVDGPCELNAQPYAVEPDEDGVVVLNNQNSAMTFLPRSASVFFNAGVLAGAIDKGPEPNQELSAPEHQFGLVLVTGEEIKLCGAPGMPVRGHVNFIKVAGTEENPVIIVATDGYGVFMYELNYWRLYQFQPYEPLTRFQEAIQPVYDNRHYTAAVDPEGNRHTGSIDGVETYSQNLDVWRSTLELGQNRAGIHAMSFSPEEILLGFVNKGVGLIQNGEFTLFTVDNGLPSNNVRYIAGLGNRRYAIALDPGVVLFDAAAEEFTTITPSPETEPFMALWLAPYGDDRLIVTGTETMLIQLQEPYYHFAVGPYGLCVVITGPENSLDQKMITCTEDGLRIAPLP